MIGFELALGATQRPPLASPLAAFFRHGGGQSVAIGQGMNGDLTVWTELGGNHAARMRLDNDNPTTRMSWRETQIAELRNIYPVGDMTLSGPWSQLQSSGSGRSGSYTGNRAISTGSLSAAAQVTVGRAAPYDVWVHFTARTSGGYVRVDIDGAQTLVNEIDDPAALGFKAFPTHSSVDLQRRQAVKVASGLVGSHDVSVSFGGAATPGGAAIMVEAVAISGSLSDPRILPPLWLPGATYAMGDEVQFGGVYFAARANGVSGANGPTHNTGIASDGTLDWRADDRPTYPEFVAIDYPSEREYAICFDVGGASTELGGQTHGHEILVARTIHVDGAPYVPQASGLGLRVGTTLSCVEDTLWQTQAGVDVADCQLIRTVTPGAVRHDVSVTATGPQLDVEWFYAGMVPMVRWDGESRSTVVDTIEAEQNATVDLADYASIASLNVDFLGAARLGIAGQVNGIRFAYGHEAGATAAAGNLLADFEAFLRPNLEGRSESGSLDWTAKAYVQPHSVAGMQLVDGDTVGFFNRHVFTMTSS